MALQQGDHHIVRAIFATHHQFRFTLLHSKDERRGIFALCALSRARLPLLGKFNEGMLE